MGRMFVSDFTVTYADQLNEPTYKKTCIKTCNQPENSFRQFVLIFSTMMDSYDHQNFKKQTLYHQSIFIRRPRQDQKPN